jgi:hypothetical protein
VSNCAQAPVLIGSYNDPHRYQGLTDREIASELRHVAARLLMRGKLETLLARRETGLLFVAFSMRHPRDRKQFEALAQRCVGMEYSEARRHMQLAASWGTLHRHARTIAE